MARIDISKIEGFEAMSPEEKIDALTNFEFETPAPTADTAEIDRYKAAVIKANGEAAEYKRQLREKQTESERAEAERAEYIKSLEERAATAESRNRIDDYTKHLLTQGYNAELAAATAEAMEKHDFATLFANMAIHQEERDKAADARALNQQPDLTPGKAPGVDNIEEKGVAAFRKAALGLR